MKFSIYSFNIFEFKIAMFILRLKIKEFVSRFYCLEEKQILDIISFISNSGFFKLF